MTRAASLVISVHQVTESSCTPWIETGMEVPLVQSSDAFDMATSLL